MKTREVSDEVLDSLAREVLMIDDRNQSLTDQYLDILAHGLTKKRPMPGENKVVIVGAGMAGLLAGKLLKDAGYQVTLLEANDSRVGGRIKTFRNTDAKRVFKDDQQYAEAGAMRIPSSHKLVNALIARQGLEGRKQAFYNVDVSKDDSQQKKFQTWYRCNGQQMRQADYNAAPPTPNPLGFPVTDPEWLNITAGKLLGNAYAGMNALIATTAPIETQLKGWKQIIADNDNVSVRDFLLAHFEGNEAVMQYIGTLQNLTSRSFLSILHMFIDSFYINTDESYFELKGGNYQLPESFLPYFTEDEIVFDARVVRIDQGGERVKVTTVGEPSPVPGAAEESVRKPRLDHKAREFEADFLLLTIPFSCQRFVDVVPQFSYGKRRAIIELHYDSASKVLLEFSERFWEWSEAEWEQHRVGTPYRGHDSVGGGSVTDNPNRYIYFPSHKVDGSNGGVILASYTWADDAIRWDSIPDDDRYAYALAGLVDLYGAGIMRFFTGHGQTQSWIRDYYAMGEAAVFAPGQITELHPHIAKPEGRVFFAGEHTSLKHAWIEGALESAIRACLEINGPQA